MKKRYVLNNFKNNDRKILYIVLSIVMLSVLTLTVVYASLSTTLNIIGTAEVTAASWDIYLDNVVLNSNSVTSNVPIITDKTTVSFSTTLSKPGDYYMFTIDVVNNGTIDAMVNSITKTPELTDTQKKYLNYVVEYQNGESITTKHLVSKKSFVRLKVKVEFRKDLTASDLPVQSETLDLAFKVNYVQSDDSSGNTTINNNGKLVKLISGDYDTVGSEVCIAEECFYVISSDDASVTMLAKYNLEVGSVCTSSSSCIPIENPSGIQDSEVIGEPIDDSYPRYGTVSFSSTNYWLNTVSTYPAYVYDNNSILFEYVENYKIYLENLGTIIEEARLITYEELETLGCIGERYGCGYGAPRWVYSVSYWSGSAYSDKYVWMVVANGGFGNGTYFYDYEVGVRPVITISKSLI